jgi:hypothetical protein
MHTGYGDINSVRANEAFFTDIGFAAGQNPVQKHRRLAVSGVN